MSVVIKIENVSKQYRLGLIGTKTLKGDLQSWWYRMRGLPDPTLMIGQENKLSATSLMPAARRPEEFIWALKDINLDIEQGEVLGIIGKNGAGKSTLLKLLSRVTAPTTGNIKVKGRIASLLEVGTGFHPELTGRENIFLNGAILGMNRTEIKSKLEEIIEFAEINTYIDTPVKRYSSGMYVRLAFAVAAHLNSEIIILDEVLAVGDTLFQRKCIEKITSISKCGRTIIFVSHNLSALKTLCNSGILLQEGVMINSKDNIESIIDKYTKQDFLNMSGKKLVLIDHNRDEWYSELIFEELEFDEYPIRFGDKIKFRLKLQSRNSKIFPDTEIGIAINDRFQNCILHVGNRFINQVFVHRSDNTQYVFEIENSLAPGNYTITLFLRTGEKIQDWLTNIGSFKILDGNPYGYLDTRQLQGIILPKFTISTVE